ncbi:hypothetical protein KIN20_018247 [Parelaphostrongylus tenuis]|uniref:Uncharacterized protein n=1 Tax=Parelaphostrongylus tenuis TaxID=148309 RepID=A0AAD5N416_PARTN|nr:hypothetical protein KIN20_018247 [Parelaphostrongylus tenuis]
MSSQAIAYFFTATATIQKYQLEFISEKGSTPTSEDSIVRELMSLSDYGADGFSASCSSAQDRVLGLICRSTNPRETTTMFIACSSKPPLLTTFLKLQMHDPQWTTRGASEITEDIRPSLNEKVLDSILSNRKNLPPVRMASSQQQLLKNLFDFFDTANKNQVVLRAALDMSHDRLNEMIKFANQLTERQNAIDHRLLQIFRQSIAIKEKMEQIRPSFFETLDRIDKISTHLADNQKLTPDEAKFLTVLKEYRTKMFTNAMKTSKLSLEAAQLQREIKGPARAFTASPAANLYVLQHSQEELSSLKRRLDSISTKLEEYGMPRIAENKENIRSLC